MLAERYFDTVGKVLDEIRRTQMDSIHTASQMIADSIIAGGVLYVFGASHTGILTQELVYRAGGLMLVNPIFAPGLSLDVRPAPMTSEIERLPGYGTVIIRNTRISDKDVIIVASVSGRNPVPIEIAMEAKKRGAKVIVLTSIRYSSSVSSRHPSGKRLFETDVDLVLDNCGVPGDAAIEVEGLGVKTGPTSTIAGCAILNAIIVEVIGRLVEAGVEVPVFLSGNLDEGDRHNRAFLEKYREKLTYL
ncbi:MAG: SIS domain-containing protein [Firmicutes bacterium]|nr:SIS domain-containing protein [Bacillota bacterium]